MHFRTKMMLCVVAVVEEDPVVNLPVATYAPRDRFVRVSPIVTEVSIQVAETMAQVEKRKKKQHVTPVDKTDRVRRNNKRQHQYDANKRCELDCAPADIGVSPLDYVAFDHCWVIAKEA